MTAFDLLHIAHLLLLITTTHLIPLYAAVVLEQVAKTSDTLVLSGVDITQFLNLDSIPDSLRILIYLISGGGIVQLFKLIIDRSEVQIGGANAFRQSLIDENTALRAELNRVRMEESTQLERIRKESVQWRDKYYDALSVKISVEGTHRQLEVRVRELVEDNHRLKRKLDASSTLLDSVMNTNEREAFLDDASDTGGLEDDW